MSVPGAHAVPPLVLPTGALDCAVGAGTIAGNPMLTSIALTRRLADHLSPGAAHPSDEEKKLLKMAPVGARLLRAVQENVGEA